MSANRTAAQVPGRAGDRWRLDPARSRAEFRVAHFWGLVTVQGHFERLEGWLELDEHAHGRLELTIDAASLNTANPKRDAHLRSADFFDTEHHPKVRFRASDLGSRPDGRIHVAGELEAGGRHLRLELQPTLERTGDLLQIEAAATVDQRLLGMRWSPLGMVRAPSTLTVRACLRPEA